MRKYYILLNKYLVKTMKSARNGYNAFGGGKRNVPNYYICVMFYYFITELFSYLVNIYLFLSEALLSYY